jgi:hypothetical protein
MFGGEFWGGGVVGDLLFGLFAIICVRIQKTEDLMTLLDWIQ